MTPVIAALLGFVEGLTEYLPVSSTGHLILVSRWLGLRGEGVDAFDVVIQLGAILAVAWYYRRLLVERFVGAARGSEEGLALVRALVVGFVPTALAGVLLRSTIKRALFGPWPVAIALIGGGFVMMGVQWHIGRRRAPGVTGLGHVTSRRALIVGLGQCFSLWPGASRSMCTMVAGQLAGLSTATAAEYSFLLGLPTLGAATLYEAYKSRHALSAIGSTNVAIGLVVSFLVAWVVIGTFLAYVKKHGLAPFGVYRIALGLVVIASLVGSPE